MEELERLLDLMVGETRPAEVVSPG
jgi:hypothetical protein